MTWLIRGFLAGAAGTVAMTLTYYVERKLRQGHVEGTIGLRDGTAVAGLASVAGLDYDDTVVPGQIVASILRLPDTLSRHPDDIALALRWSYGSTYGLAHVILRDRFAEPWASMLFGSALMSVTFSMFPLLGHTPPPWRWPADVIITCWASHIAYVVASAATDDIVR